jgi:glycosidase
MRRAAALALLLAGCGSNPLPPLEPAAREPAAASDWWNGAVVYEVFVRSFQDSGNDGKGDIQGLISQLDYLNDGDAGTDTDLGVDAIWLMPIYPSPSTHGYDVTDYDGVNPDYGTPADLDALVAACHARGIRVILDWVPNHTSSEHPWFKDSRSSTGSAHRDWYVWSATSPGWTQPWNGGQTTWYPGTGGWYYAIFWSGMPDLNWKNAAVRAEIGAAAGRWIANHGVDGFRLDAVRSLAENGSGPGQMDQPETHAYLRELAAGVRAAKPDALVLGEAWADTSTIASYFGSTATVPSGDEVLPFDFPLADAILAGIQGGSARDIAASLDSVARTYPAGTGDAPFLTNHDQVRVATRLGTDPAKLGLAASILLTLQGTPIVYYGEEIGMQNGNCGSDECKRAPMAWTATPTTGGFTAGTPWWQLPPGTASANVASQAGAPSSLLSRYRQLIRVRKASSALRLGGLSRLPTDDAGVLAYLRADPAETVLVAHNVRADPVTVTVALPGTTAADALLVDSGAALSAAGGDSWSMTLPARKSGIWRLR